MDNERKLGLAKVGEARLRSGEALGDPHARGLYRVTVGAGYPAAAGRVGVLPCFHYSRPLGGPAPVELVWPPGSGG